MPNGVTAYTSGQVALMCAVSKATICRWIDSGKLEAFFTPGRHRRVEAGALLEFLEKYSIPVPAEVRHAANGGS